MYSQLVKDTLGLSKGTAVIQAAFLSVALTVSHPAAFSASAVLIGWSESGLHETDGSDVSVYSLAPPYATIRAQLISGGLLLKNSAGITVTYEAVADPSGSINSTSEGKGNFYQFASQLYGKALAPNQGLAGFGMPGPSNQPQTMVFDAALNCFTAQGIPITPYDDLGRKNPFPMMRLVARDQAGQTVATTSIALPVSDEMDCRSCHASGSRVDARPMEGWAWNCDPDADYKLNILRYHDGVRAGSSSYTNVLSQVGYNPAGLYATVTKDHQPILCIRCHESNALPGTGAPGMRPLTRLIHTKHAQVLPANGTLTLDQMNNSTACLQCHAGPETRYLRGVHRKTTNSDGSRTLQCQSCHGNMATVGGKLRQGWLDEPNCQSCHTGTAISTNGQIRYTNSFDVSGLMRVALNQTYATQPNTPTNGLSLYHSSTGGHGGLMCQACHGAAHAELASAQANENVQSHQIQAHSGVLLDCNSCHATVPFTANGGPHGMHPVGETWVRGHGEDDGRRNSQCQSCHGTTSLGTVLSQMGADRTMSGGLTTAYWQGFQIGCYNCHNGPGGGDDGGGGGRLPPASSNVSVSAIAGAPISVNLQASDPNGLALAYRAISPPANGSVSLAGNRATYYPSDGFIGTDSFTFAASDGYNDSNLGSVAVTITPGDCILTVMASAPTAALPGAAVAFHATAFLAQCTSTINYDWEFGDGSPHGTDAHVCHTYASTNTLNYSWTLTVSAGGAKQTLTGTVAISSTLGPPVPLAMTGSPDNMVLSWPVDTIGVSLETSYDLTQPDSWQPVPDQPFLDGSTMTLPIFVVPGEQFFRLRRVP